MEGILVQEKNIVVPGQEVAAGMDFLPGNGVFREGDKLLSSKVGIVNISGRLIKIIPLAGRYLPREGDIVIGKVIGMGFSGWRINVGWPFEANLSLRDASSEFIEKNADLSRYYNYGDYVVTQIINVISAKVIDLTMKGPGLRKLGPGRLIEATPSKVPRIIGKQGSMINMIKDATGCKISVGQNGLIWLIAETPEKESLAVETIHKIEDESHISGLTDRIKEFLETKTGKKFDAVKIENAAPNMEH